MRPRPLLLAPLLVVTALAASACNLIFSIVPGEPTGTGGGTTTGTGGGTTTSTGNTGGMGGTGGTGAGGSSTTGSTGGAGGAPSCTPDTATCQGAVLHPCDASGHPAPAVACDAIAACDAVARACVPLASLPRLSVGAGHACAIEDDRSVRCWGINDTVLLPEDTHVILPAATPLANVTGVRQITVATGQACVLQDSGTVLCWGSNDSGETGVPEGSPKTPAKVALPGSLPALEVSASHRCSCARLAGGSVACWGQEETGCFGTGALPAKVHPTPTLVPGVTDAVQLRTGTYDVPSCVRRASGKVLCWGMNTPPKEVPGVDDAVDITLGRYLVFIRSASKGMLWTVPMGDGFAPVVPYGVIGTLTAMSAGEAFCALRDDGVPLCGLIDGAPPDLPALIPKLPQGKIVEISAGYGLTYGIGLQCLRLEGAPIASRVYCWGDDLAGAVGANSPSNFRTPQLVPGISGVTALTAAQQSTTVVLANGSVAYWGQSSALEGIGAKNPKVVGTLGNGNARVSTNDVYRLAYVVKNTGALALLDTGLPVQNQRLQQSGASDFMRADDRGHYDLALRANGSLLVFGDDVSSNVTGIFGDGTTTAVLGPPKAVPGLAGVKAVASYGDDYGFDPAHACAILDPGGTVSCWGYNGGGEIGSGPTNTVVPTPTSIPIPNGEAIVSIGVGRFFTCAVSAAGTIYCWGSNDTGQLGVDPIFTNILIPNAIAGITNAIGVTAQNLHACAWLADKTAVCWGGNDEGELGDGTFEPRYAPTPVTGLTDVVELVAGPYHTCARHTPGTISCWGSSYNAQVGTGAIGIFDSPLMVVGL